MPAALNGVFPVLATPFNADLSPDERGLCAIARYAIDAGADGVVYPGVASEYDMLTMDERKHLVDVVAAVARDRVSLIVGASASDVATTEAISRHAAELGADAVMVMAPKTSGTGTDVITFFRRIASAGSVPIMLQNAPPPAGSGLAVDVVLDVVRTVPEIAYVKEESLPSGMAVFSSNTNGHEKTGFIAHGDSVLSVSITVPGSKDLTSDFKNLYINLYSNLIG